MSFSPKAKRNTPFLSIMIRERHRPEPSISSAELYFMFAMAATHCTPLDVEAINVSWFNKYITLFFADLLRFGC